MNPFASPRSDARAPGGGWLPLSAAQRWQRLALGLAAPLAMAATPEWLRQGRSLGCGFRALTGLPCPLCGGTHACAALVQGEWVTAWAANPGAVALLVWLLVCAATAAGEAAAGRRPARPWPWWRPGTLLGLAAIVLATWAARLAGWG
jgi:hypothetical protein